MDFLRLAAAAAFVTLRLAAVFCFTVDMDGSCTMSGAFRKGGPASTGLGLDLMSALVDAELSNC
jgi:hypothetical protein